MVPLDDALDELDLDRGAGTDDLRRAFRHALKQAHPDHGGTRRRLDRVVAAEAVVRAAFDDDDRLPAAEPIRSAPSTTMAARGPIVLETDSGEVFDRLEAAVAGLGSVVRSDRAAGHLEGIVQLDTGPPGLLQIEVLGDDRSEVMFTLDPTDDRPPPPIEAVVRRIAAAVAG